MPRPSILLMLCAIPLAACASDPGRINEAAEQRAADDPQAMARIADAAVRSGDIQSANAFYSRAAKLAPTDVPAQIRYANTLAALGRVNEAVAALRQAQAHAPDDASLSLALGQCLVSTRQAGAAAGVFRRGLAAHPRNAALLVGLGVALDLARDPAGAQAAYMDALKLDPGSTAARNDLALSLALSNQPSEAIRRLSALRDDLARDGAAPAQVATVDGNLALAYGLAGDMGSAMQAGGASMQPGDLARNARFYSALAGGPPKGAARGATGTGTPGSGAGDRSGLPASAGSAAPSEPAGPGAAIAPMPD